MYFIYNYFFKISIIDISLIHPRDLSVLCVSSIVCSLLLEEISGVGDTVMTAHNSDLCRSGQGSDYHISVCILFTAHVLSFIYQQDISKENLFIDFVISACFNISSCCVRLLLGRHEGIFIHFRKRISNKPKYKCHQSPITFEPMSFIGVI